MTREATRSKRSPPNQQQGGPGSLPQQEQHDGSRQPGGDPDVHEKMPDRDFDRIDGDPRRQIDVERE